jgi:hypothetical protein
MTTTMTTCFGGALVWRDGVWVWRDGTPEPRVRDLTLSRAHNLPCITYSTGRTYVEVPVSMLYDSRNPELARWRGLPRHLDGGRSIVRVPVEEWDAAPPCGAVWDLEDEPAILARARALGQ